jgi:CubicO group peptidase (beta-lactamase class C family)
MVRQIQSLCAASLFTLAAVLPPLGAAAQDAQPPRREYVALADRLERLIDREMRAQGLPILSIALVDDQDVVWAKGFGVVD